MKRHATRAGTALLATALLATALLTTALLTTGCSRVEVKCDAATVAEVARPAIEGLAAGKRADFAVRLLTETCTEPADLRAALKSWEITRPEDRARTVAKAIDDNRGIWKMGCPGGMDTFEAIARTAEREKVLFEGCALSRFDGVKPETLALETAMIGVLYAPVLEKSTIAPADRALILQALFTR